MTYAASSKQHRINQLFAERPWLERYFLRSDVSMVHIERADEDLLKNAGTLGGGGFEGDHLEFRICLVDESGELIAAVGEDGEIRPLSAWDRFWLQFFRYVLPLKKHQSLWEKLVEISDAERERISYIAKFCFNSRCLWLIKPPNRSPGMTIAELFEKCRAKQAKEVEVFLTS